MFSFFSASIFLDILQKFQKLMKVFHIFPLVTAKKKKIKRKKSKSYTEVYWKLTAVLLQFSGVFWKVSEDFWWSMKFSRKYSGTLTEKKRFFFLIPIFRQNIMNLDGNFCKSIKFTKLCAAILPPCKGFSDYGPVPTWDPYCKPPEVKPITRLRKPQ